LGELGIIQLVRARLAGDPKIVEIVGVLDPNEKGSGYKFDGWYNEEGGKLKSDGSDKLSGRFTTFYARWTKQ